MDGSTDVDTDSQRAFQIGVFLASTLVSSFFWWYRDFQPKIQGDAHMSCDRFYQASHTATEIVLHLFKDMQITRLSWDLPFCFVVQYGSLRAWLVIQTLMYGLAVVFVYDTGRRLLDRRAGLVASLGMTFSWASVRFIRRPQSDLQFIFVLCVVLWAITRYYLDRTRRNKYVLFGALAILSTTRPFGFPVLFGWLLADALFDDTTKSLGLVTRSRYTWIASGAIFAFLAFALIRRGVPGRWPIGVVVTHPTGPTVQYVYDVAQASNLLTFAVLNADHLLIMGLLRVAWFFVPVLPRWSTIHIAVNAVTLFPLIVGAFLGVGKIVTQRRYDLALLWLVPLAMLILPVAVLYLDGGFHYRAPAVPIFALLTGYAVSEMDWWTLIEE